MNPEQQLERIYLRLRRRWLLRLTIHWGAALFLVLGLSLLSVQFESTLFWLTILGGAALLAYVLIGVRRIEPSPKRSDAILIAEALGNGDGAIGATNACDKPWVQSLIGPLAAEQLNSALRTNWPNPIPLRSALFLAASLAVMFSGVALQASSAQSIESRAEVAILHPPLEAQQSSSLAAEIRDLKQRHLELKSRGEDSSALSSAQLTKMESLANSMKSTAARVNQLTAKERAKKLEDMQGQLRKTAKTYASNLLGPELEEMAEELGESSLDPSTTLEKIASRLEEMVSTSQSSSSSTERKAGGGEENPSQLSLGGSLDTGALDPNSSRDTDSVPASYADSWRGLNQGTRSRVLNARESSLSAAFRRAQNTDQNGGQGSGD